MQFFCNGTKSWPNKATGASKGLVNFIFPSDGFPKGPCQFHPRRLKRRGLATNKRAAEEMRPELAFRSWVWTLNVDTGRRFSLGPFAEAAPVLRGEAGSCKMVQTRV